jgi:RNA polymerase sigma factor (sigma-70 family)
MKFVLKRFSIDRDTIEDIYQESFIALYENIRQGKYLKSSSSLQSYLFAIGKHKLLNYLRDNNREMVDISGNIIPLEIQYESEDWKRKQEIVYQSVSKMQEPCNRILSLFYYDQKSMAEIARTFNYKNEQVAKNRKHICISKLKATLMTLLKQEDLI